jgi:hypothetical protein
LRGEIGLERQGGRHAIKKNSFYLLLLQVTASFQAL